MHLSLYERLLFMAALLGVLVLFALPRAEGFLPHCQDVTLASQPEREQDCRECLHDLAKAQDDTLADISLLDAHLDGQAPENARRTLLAARTLFCSFAREWAATIADGGGCPCSGEDVRAAFSRGLAGTRAACSGPGGFSLSEAEAHLLARGLPPGGYGLVPVRRALKKAHCLGLGDPAAGRFLAEAGEIESSLMILDVLFIALREAEGAPEAAAWADRLRDTARPLARQTRARLESDLRREAQALATPMDRGAGLRQLARYRTLLAGYAGL